MSQASLYSRRQNGGSDSGEAASQLLGGSSLTGRFSARQSAASFVLPPFSGPGVRPEVPGLRGPFALRGAGDDALESRPRDPVSEQRSGVVPDDAVTVGHGGVGVHGGTVASQLNNDHKNEFHCNFTM